MGLFSCNICMKSVYALPLSEKVALVNFETIDLLVRVTMWNAAEHIDVLGCRWHSKSVQNAFAAQKLKYTANSSS